MTKIKKITPKSIISKVVIALVLIIDVYPIFWLLTASVKRNSEWVDYPAYALPKGFYWQNYVEAWTRGHMATFFKNSLIDTLISLIFIVIFSTTVSFACVKMQWKLKIDVACIVRFEGGQAFVHQGFIGLKRLRKGLLH